jgi:DNA-binding CsgD family transcriptional regulator/tetratricopeptide (TPR) repeat protein
MASDPRCQRVWIMGAPGTGKSATCEWAIEQAPSFLPARWACIEGEAELPLGALVALLRPLRRYTEGLTSTYRQVLRRLVEHGSAGDDLFSIGAATLALLAEASENQPVMVLIDDFQWIDPASATILTFALRRLDADAVIAILASRLNPGGSWLDRSLHLVELGGLPSDAALAVLEEGGPIAPSVAEAVITATGGVPLALKEVSSQLTVHQRLGFEALPEPLPVGEHLLTLYQDRIAPLELDTRLALGVAAAAGSAHLSIPPALRTLKLNEDALTAAEEASVVRFGPTGPVFPHPLLRTASLAVLSPAQRRQVHAALAAVSDNLEERAVHFSRSSAGPSQAVAEQLENLASTLSERQGAVIAAGIWLHAGQLTPPGPSRIARLLRAGQELASVGRVTEAKQCFDEIIATSDDPIARADAVMVSTLARLLTPNATRLASEAVAEADRVEPVSPMHAQGLRAIAIACFVSQGDAGAALALPLSMEPGPDVARLPPTLETIWPPELLCLDGRDQEAAAWVPPERVRAMINLAEEGRNDPVITAGLQVAAVLLTFLERRDEAMELAGALIASHRKERRPQQLPLILVAQGEALLRGGRWPEAEATLNEAITLAEHTGQPVLAAITSAILARIAGARGQQRYQRLCEDALEQAMRINYHTTEIYALHGLGLGHLSTGRFRGAIEAFDRLSEVAKQAGLKGPTVVPYRADHIEALIRGGQSRRAAEVTELFQLEAQNSGSRWARATHARVKAMLTGDEHAGELFEASSRDLYDQPFEMARTDLCWGESLRRQRHIPESRDHLAAAARMFDRLEARPWAERARGELRATGARTPTLQRTVLSELTPQEMQVAVSVGQGSTNRDAAAQLFISPKTVEHHLSSIYQKLGLRSRIDLARLLPTLTDS